MWRLYHKIPDEFNFGRQWSIINPTLHVVQTKELHWFCHSPLNLQIGTDT
jgi:hypothetical protein